MKRVMVAAAMVVAGSAWMRAADDPKVIYVPHEQTQKVGPVASGPGFSISVNQRKDKPSSEMHEKETDTIYVLSGQATMVTGGKGIDMKLTRPGQWLGTGIEGGERHVLSKGDVLVIPPGVNHWVTDIVDSPLVYHIVKVIQP